MTSIAAPPGMDAVPSYDSGWLIGGDRRQPAPFLSYAETASVNWSDELESLHEGSSRTHFIDVWTRDVIVERVGDPTGSTVLVDIGCSAGYLLDDLRAAYPEAVLIGIDLVAAGLRAAHALVPSARLLQADACDLPLEDTSADAVVSANLLEHLADDRRALAEIRRVLRPSARAVIVVPASPGCYDYYDRFLGHERRYGRGELAGKAAEAELDVIEDSYIASLLFPAFWLVKQRNRRRYANLEGAALARRVGRDIARTGGSRAGAMCRRIEERLRLRLPFGIRNVVVLRRAGR